MANVLLSVICTTYGHEKFIKKALDSILMQIVNFPMEVLIGEDCSPDNSREILKGYEAKHPGFFTVFYREKNLGPHNNLRDLEMRAKGKYIAYLELDDYWTDQNKLQQQVDVLEHNEDVFAVVHRTEIVNNNDVPINDKYPECHRKYYKWNHYIRGLLPGQTATMVYRNIISTDKIWSKIISDEVLYPRDRVNAFLVLNYGKVYCIPRIMSSYRFGSEFSYATSIQTIDPEKFSEKTTAFYKELLYYAMEYYGKKAIISSEKMYVLAHTKELQIKKQSLFYYLAFALDVKYKNKVRMFFFYIMLRRVNTNIIKLFKMFFSKFLGY